MEITEIQICDAAIKEANRSQTLSSYPFDQMSVGFGFEKGAQWMQEQLEPELVTLRRNTKHNESWINTMVEQMRSLQTALKDTNEFSTDEELQEWMFDNGYSK